MTIVLKDEPDEALWPYVAFVLDTTNMVHDINNLSESNMLQGC